MHADGPVNGAPGLGDNPARLRWRCRRGMRELDRILETFFDQRFATLEPAEKRLFADILDFPDPDLHAYLLGRAKPQDPELARLFQAIRACGAA